MKKSILRLIAFSVFPFLIICYSIYITGKNTDNFYKRFTSPKQNSLILGSSRAASIDPEIIDKIIHQKFSEAKMYNYAFTWAHSPFGSKYLESIKKKLKPDTQNGVFIVTVEPSAVMVYRDKPDNPENYFENTLSVAKTSMVSVNPNIEYLLESYDFSITHELNKRIMPPKNVIAETKVLDNGKVNIKILKPQPPEKRAALNTIKMIEFRDKMKSLKISKNRLFYLSETINFLKKHGNVIVVRLPINTIPYTIENEFFKDFDQRILHICSKEKVEYINYNNLQNLYKWTDEVHLEPASMKFFSNVLAHDILSIK